MSDNYLQSPTPGITINLGPSQPDNYLENVTKLKRLAFQGNRILEEIEKSVLKRSELATLDYTSPKFMGYELLMTPGSPEDLLTGAELIIGDRALAEEMFKQLGIIKEENADLPT